MIISQKGMNLKMSLNKGNMMRKVLPLFLALAVSAGTVFAQEEAPDTGVQDTLEDAGQEEEVVLQPEDEQEKQPRAIKADEEVTYTCGEVFSLDAELIDGELLKEGEQSEEAEEESPEDEAFLKAEETPS